jgi:glycerophosphodiester phosphodiesterase
MLNGIVPLSQANAFYSAKEEELHVKLDELECELRSADPMREKAAQRTLVKEVCPELGCLREYVVLNYTAVVKGVKKGNKNLGQTTHAVQLLAGEPIFCSLGLAKLVTRAEMLTVHAAPAAERKMADHCCPICDEVLSNPIILPCKHRFCFKCIAVATLNDSSATKLTASSAASPFGDMSDDFVISPSPESFSHSLLPDLKMTSSSLNRTSNCTLVRGACPVCKKPHVNDESGLRVDPQLDEFIKTHFLNESATSLTEQDEQQSRSTSLNHELRMPKPLHQPVLPSAMQTIPKALIIVVAGCRSDALLAADAPTLAAYVRGQGCFSFHMQHTWNRCSRTPSDAVMPLLTGSEGAALETAQKERKGDLDRGKNVKNVFARLAEVRSWVRVAAAVGGAPDLASVLAADNTELLASPNANDEVAVEAAAHSLAAGKGPDALCLHLNGVQDAGVVHGYGPHITGYREAVEMADARIARVLRSLRARQAAHPHEEWLVMIASPAGGTARADMPAAMQGHFDAADWCGGGGRQLRAAGVTGLGSLPQHATGWVLIDTPAGAGFGGGCTIDGRACGELLPPPCDVDIAPTLLEHFGVAPRREWELDGAHLLAARRTDAALSQTSEMSTGTSLSLASTKSGKTLDGLQHSKSSPRSATGQTSDIIASRDSVATKNSSSHVNHNDGNGDDGNEVICGDKRVDTMEHSALSAPGPFASHLPGLFEPTGCAVVGHRGFGMNRCSGRGIRENTVASFIAAHGSGAGWCEFDVQVTADGTPVLWHDDVLLVRHGLEPIQSFSIRELDLSELKALSRAAIATAAATAAGVPAAMAAAMGVDATEGSTGETKFHCSGSGGVDDDEEDDDDEDETPADIPVVFYRRFPVGYGARLAPEPEPWIMDLEDEIPTLAELMKHAPPELGFSMELKFDEANPCATPRLVAELRAILAVCRAHPTRRILFSSFDPDAALLMRALQGLYPVMLISDCKPDHADPRRCSVGAAKKCALDGGLCGLVLDVKVLAKGPQVADEVRSSGLLLGTYGKENDCKPLASKQVEWGMCLVCTDNVAVLAGMFNAPMVEQGNTAPALAPLMSPSLDAAAAARKLGEMELEAVMRAPWYQLSEDGKRCNKGKAGVSIPLRSGRRHVREGGSGGMERVGTAEALSALATEAAGLATATAERLELKGAKPSATSANMSLTRVSESALATPPPQPTGVVAKGYDNSWAMFPAHRPSSHQRGKITARTWRSGIQAATQ